MSQTFLHGRLYRAAIVSLYICSLIFLLPLILCHLDRPGARLSKMPVVHGSAQFAIADFDGDRQPDLATIRVIQNSSRATEYFLELQLSSGARPAIGILGPVGGLQITPQDVNGDKFADLVVTSLLDSHLVAILVNDGKGNFKQVETSDYPEVGKCPGSGLISPAGSAAYQLTLGQNAGTDKDGVEPSLRHGLVENSSESLLALQLYAHTSGVLEVVDRAPPVV